MYIELFESGLVPIPIKPKTKEPAVSGFHYWAHDGIPEEKVQEFELNFPASKGYGVGILCGAASGICVVDIDSDDPEIMAACPPSPIRRRGKKGEARFFRFNPDVPNRAFAKKDEDQRTILHGIDILCDRKYIIIPPSIHPDTGNPYVWLTPDVLGDFDVADLPMLYPEDVDKMGAILGSDDQTSMSGGSIDLSGVYHSPDGHRCPHGSYHRLKALAQGLIAKGSQITEAVKALIDYDKEHHKGVAFFEEDRRHTDFGADPFSNALRLYANLLKTTNEQRIRKGFAPQLPDTPKEIDITSMIENAEEMVDLTTLEPYPKPRGMMAKFMAYCELMGKGRQDALGLGGALAMMSVVSANRFQSNVRGLDVWPNLYVLNLGFSAFGKDTCQKLIKILLFDEGLVGATNYKSGTSMIQELPKKQERLDLIDEATQLLDAMHAREPFKKEMADVLTQLFSSASNLYIGMTSVQNSSNFGACWNPCVSVLGSTTPAGFKSSVNQEMAAKGLLPRFLTFFQKDIGDWKGHTDVDQANQLVAELRTWCQKITALEKPIHKDFKPKINYVANIQDDNHSDMSMGTRWQPNMVPMDHKAHDIWMDFERDCHKRAARNPDGLESAFYGRFAEIAAKLALLDTVSLIPLEGPVDLSSLKIDVDSMLWAIDVCTICWKNSKALYEMSTAKNQIEAETIQIVEFVKSIGGFANMTQLSRKFRSMSKKQLNDRLETLVDAELLSRGEEKTKGRPKVIYFLPELSAQITDQT